MIKNTWDGAMARLKCHFIFHSGGEISRGPWVLRRSLNARGLYLRFEPLKLSRRLKVQAVKIEGGRWLGPVGHVG